MPVTFYVIAASCAFSVGGALMKASEGFQRLRPTMAVLVLFVLGAACMARALHRDQLSRAFIIGLGIEAVVSVLIGITVLGERLSGPQLAGVALIVVGVGILRV
ncbi:MAG: SMR family transporter [Acidimicrobiales bacterium]